jgi:hypothetical protein
MAGRHGEAKQSWWSRHWFWVLPGGCLGCCTLMVGSCVLFLGGMVASFRTSEGFQAILAQIESHPEVVAALGEPIEPGWMFNGNINVENSVKTVDVAVPISGPLGGGMLYVAGVEKAGIWQFERLEVELDNGDWIDLLEKPSGELIGAISIRQASCSEIFRPTPKPLDFDVMKL